MNTKLFSISLLTAGVLLASASPASASGYKFTDLGTLGRVGLSHAMGINNSGQVVGSSYTLDGLMHATIWNGTTPTDLGTLGGSWSEATGINDSGQVVGWSYTVVDSGADGLRHATIWNGTTPTDLGTLGVYSAAYGINDSGQVVGVAEENLGSPNLRATLWNGTTSTDLGTLGGYTSIAFDINNSGQVVGHAYVIGDCACANPYATIWNGTTPTNLGPISGYPWLDYSEATAINNSGQVVGQSGFGATIWNGTTPTYLGTLGGNYSAAWGINNSGQVVGVSNTTSGGTTHATIWNGTTPTDLNDFLSVSEVSAGLVLYGAYGINDSGWIVGDGSHGAFLLVPIPVPAVPEPETYALFMAGLGLMGFIARRRKNGQA